VHEPGHASGALIFPTLFRQLPPAVRNLDAIERDELAIDTAAEWYALHRGSGKQQGRLAVLNDLSVLRVQFDAIPRIVEDIDIRNSRFSGAALQKIRYLLRQDRQTEGQLQFIIDTLAKTHVPDIEFDVYKCELLVGDFLYTPPSERLRPKPQMLTKRTRVGGLVMSSRQVASNRRTKIGNRYGVFGELFCSAGGPRQKTLPRQGGYTTTESRTARDSKRCATGEE